MDIGQKAGNEAIKRLEKELKSLYSNCYKKNKSELEKVMNKLIKNYNKLDQTEILKLWNDAERYENLLKSLAEYIKNANEEAIKMLNNELINIYSENYNFGAFTVENSSGVNCGYNIYNNESIKKLLADNVNPFTMISLDEAKDKDIIYRLLKRQFTQAIINGESIEEIAERVKATTEKSYSDSVRIARTETTRIESLGRQEAYKHGENLGLKLKKKWISTGDSRTRERHLNMMNETVGLDEKFSNGLEYPGAIGGKASEVINCRCTHVVEFDGVEKSAKELKLDADLKKMSYEEWKKRKTSNTKANKEPAAKVKTKTVKTDYTGKELTDMNIKNLKKVAKELALEYYPKNGINYGDRSIEDVVNELINQDRTKTSLIKDIKSFQRKLKR